LELGDVRQIVDQGLEATNSVREKGRDFGDAIVLALDRLEQGSAFGFVHGFPATATTEFE
jgi:hypothetical protein